MKATFAKPIFLILLITLFSSTNQLIAQEKEKERFASVNLQKLKSTLQKNLIKDELISSKKEAFYLAVDESKLTINGKELNSDQVLKYQKILASFKVGYGPHRKIYISPKGTAVGDFKDNGFFGVAKGVFEDSVLGSS